MINAKRICANYNAQVKTMIECSKKRDADESRYYWQAFSSKHTIESTLKLLGLKLEFNNKGKAVGIEVITM